MNVLGHRERSWRKAKKRGVSPIIATILLVAITVVLAAVLYVLISGLTHGTGGTTLGSAFAAGPATPPLIVGTATTTGEGCASTHYCYILTIESASSGISVSSFNVVLKTATGTTATAGLGQAVTAAGQFTVYNSVTAAIVSQTATVAAGGTMSATTWTNAGLSTTQLTSTMIIVIDTGVTTAATDSSPSGTGLVMSFLGVGSYSGTVSVNLP
jgi:archaeal type IV pilus assembly protein PilA